MIMDSKERIKYQKEMQAAYEYLRANQGRLHAAGCSFYMLYHNNREKGMSLDNYFDMLKEFASGLLPAMDEIRGRKDEEV